MSSTTTTSSTPGALRMPSSARNSSSRSAPARPLDQRRLPHSRLAAEQDQPSFAAGGLRRVLGQQRQGRLPFQQRRPDLDRRRSPDPHPRPSPVRKALYVNRRTTRPYGSGPSRSRLPWVVIVMP